MAILDFDVHHGNGTGEPPHAWPGRKSGRIEELKKGRKEKDGVGELLGRRVGHHPCASLRPAALPPPLPPRRGLRRRPSILSFLPGAEACAMSVPAPLPPAEACVTATTPSIKVLKFLPLTFPHSQFLPTLKLSLRPALPPPAEFCVTATVSFVKILSPPPPHKFPFRQAPLSQRPASPPPPPPSGSSSVPYSQLPTHSALHSQILPLPPPAEACVTATIPSVKVLKFSTPFSEGAQSFPVYRPWLGAGDRDNIFFARWGAGGRVGGWAGWAASVGYEALRAGLFLGTPQGRRQLRPSPAAAPSWPEPGASECPPSAVRLASWNK